MMSKLLFVLALVGLSPAFADADLESILDSGSVTTKKMESDETSTWFLKQFSKPNSYQMEVAHKIGRGDFTSALLGYPQAVSGTSLESATSGRAFKAWLMYQAGLKVTGLESLWVAGSPNKMDPFVQKLWKKTATVHEAAWAAARLSPSAEWENVFPGSEAYFQIRSIGARTPISKLKELIAKAPAKSMLQAKAQWNLVIALSLDNQAGVAASELAKLMRENTKPVSLDLMNLTAGRLLYQNAYFDGASKFYSKVPKSSDLWVEAQEELGWTYLRRGEAAQAIAISKDLLHPGLNGLVSAEVDLVNAMAYLKVCDYKAVLGTLDGFAKRYKNRNQRLEQLAKNSNDAQVMQVLAQLEKGRLSAGTIGVLLHSVPRAVLRDQELFELAQNRATLSKELKVAGDIYSKSLAATGLQGQYDAIQKNLSQRAESNKDAALSRIQLLAKREAEEIQNVLKKMHIVEAEVIEQVSIADKILKAETDKKTQKQKIVSSADTLKFPAEGEVWFDEISFSKVDVKKGCAR